MRTQVFISYRRNGGLESAKYIYNLLSTRHKVFFDMESLRSGRFDVNIEDAIKNCTDFLLILSKNVFDRLNEEGDWISREIGLALKHSKNIIPILLEGFLPPESTNSSIKAVMDYNGITFSKDEVFLKKLTSFLKSNRNCTLEIDCSEHGYSLSQSAIDVLKEIYRNIVSNQENDVQVDLKFPPVDEVCEKLVPLTADTDRNALILYKKQVVIGKQQQHRAGIEKAIEIMISDRANIEYPSLEGAISNEPLCKEYYFDSDGRLHTYGIVCVWVKIIEELLKEFTIDDMNRLTYYRNKRNIYTTVDCTIDRISKEKNDDWYFISCVKKEEATKDVTYYQLMKHSPLELSAETLLTNILPDFYHKIALELIYNRSESLKEELKNPQAPIRFLLNYWYGLR